MLKCKKLFTGALLVLIIYLVIYINTDSKSVGAGHFIDMSMNIVNNNEIIKSIYANNNRAEADILLSIDTNTDTYYDIMI